MGSDANIENYSYRTDAEASRKLGWQPKKTEKDFRNHYVETAKLVMEAQKK